MVSREVEDSVSSGCGVWWRDSDDRFRRVVAVKVIEDEPCGVMIDGTYVALYAVSREDLFTGILTPFGE